MLESRAVKLTLLTQLLPDEDQARKLSATMQAFNAAADWLAGEAFRLKTANKIELQQLYYRKLRDDFGISAQMAIRCIRRAVLTVIRDFCPPEESFVFTNVLDAKAPEDKALFRRIERLAKQRKATFFPVWLTCDAEMIRQRKNTPERRARLKDIDLTTILWYLQEFEVLKAPHPNALTLDTSHCKPEQAAQRILEHVRGINR